MWVELGLQTIHDESARFINRCYDLSVFDNAMHELASHDIKTVVHLIMGIPGETQEMMLDSVKYVTSKPDLFGIKLHLLNVVKGSRLAEEYSTYLPLNSIDDYVDLIVQALEIIPQHVTIHRLTGDALRKILLSPPWSFNKRTILNKINQELNLKDTWQGKKAK